MERKISASEGARTSTNIIIADMVRVTASETQTITSRKLGIGHEEVADGFGLGADDAVLFFFAIIVFPSSVLSSLQAGFACPQQNGLVCMD